MRAEHAFARSATNVGQRADNGQSVPELLVVDAFMLMAFAQQQSFLQVGSVLHVQLATVDQAFQHLIWKKREP